MKKIIGYQGGVGSNAEEAAQKMAAALKIEGAEYRPLITSKGVVDGLKDHTIDLGVMAVCNSLGGVVIETADAIKGLEFEVIMEQVISIHHCLFKKNERIENQYLKSVASHIQALRQTEKTRQSLFPYLKAEVIEDTAIGAKWLAEGRLPDTTAVICRKNAGELYHLALVKENIEDSTDNETTFKMFKLIK